MKIEWKMSWLGWSWCNKSGWNEFSFNLSNLTCRCLCLTSETRRAYLVIFCGSDFVFYTHNKITDDFRRYWKTTLFTRCNLCLVLILVVILFVAEFKSVADFTFYPNHPLILSSWYWAWRDEATTVFGMTLTSCTWDGCSQPNEPPRTVVFFIVYIFCIFQNF